MLQASYLNCCHFQKNYSIKELFVKPKLTIKEQIEHMSNKGIKFDCAIRIILHASKKQLRVA